MHHESTATATSARSIAFIVFARAPELGRVKTRLAASLGAADALEVYRWLGLRTVDAVRVAARALGNARIVVYHTPPERADAIVAWLGPGLALRPQRDGDLGARMAHAIEAELVRGADVAVVVGTDCPSLDADTLAEAVARAEGSDVVLGPATDGGYYLIAARRAHPALFADIPWSSPDTLRRTLEAAAREGLATTLLDERFDIDCEDDWHRWRAGGDGHSVPGAAG